MKAGSTSETSANFYQTTRRNIPEDSHLQDCFVPHHFQLILRNLPFEVDEALLDRQRKNIKMVSSIQEMLPVPHQESGGCGRLDLTSHT
jgi:hypothetical protein